MANPTHSTLRLEITPSMGEPIAAPVEHGPEFRLEPAEPLPPVRILLGGKGAKGRLDLKTAETAAQADSLFRQLKQILRVESTMEVHFADAYCIAKDAEGNERHIDYFENEEAMGISNELAQLIHEVSGASPFPKKYERGYKSRIDASMSPFNPEMAAARVAARARRSSVKEQAMYALSSARWNPLGASRQAMRYDRIAALTDIEDLFDKRGLEKHLESLNPAAQRELLKSLHKAQQHINAYKAAIDERIAVLTPPAGPNARREIEVLNQLKRQLEELDLYAIQLAICNYHKPEGIGIEAAYRLREKMLEAFKTPSEVEATYATDVAAMMISDRIEYLQYYKACQAEQKKVSLEEHIARLAVGEDHHHRDFRGYSESVREVFAAKVAGVNAYMGDLNTDLEDPTVDEYIAALRRHEASDT